MTSQSSLCGGKVLSLRLISLAMGMTIVLAYSGALGSRKMGAIPLSLAIALLTLVLVLVWIAFARRAIGLFPAWLLFVMLLPFLHLWTFIGFHYTDDSGPPLFWKVGLNSYIQDERIQDLTATAGLILAASFVGGLWAVRPVTLIPPKVEASQAWIRMTGFEFSSLAIVAVLLAWVSAPQNLLLGPTDLDNAPLGHAAGLYGGWLGSVVLAAVLAADIVKSSETSRIRYKVVVLITLLVVNVGWFGLLRGTREQLAGLFAVLFIFLFWGRNSSKPKLLARIAAVSVVTVVLVAGSALGVIRTEIRGATDPIEVAKASLVALEREQFFGQGLFHGTWSAVLLTPVSVVGDWDRGTRGFDGGRSVLDLVLSIPPGPIAKAIGYERPFSSDSNPAWEMRYGGGGTHALVLPFMSFGFIGVAAVGALYGMASSLIDRGVRGNSLSGFRLLSLGFLAGVAPWGLWYGDKYWVNAALVLALVWVYIRMRRVLIKSEINELVHEG